MRSNLLTLHDPALSRAFYANGQWRDETLYMTARHHALDDPDRYALRDANWRLTWKELVRWADAVGADLHDAGLRTGDRVAAWLPNRVECLVLMLACSREGFVCTLSLHQNHTVDEVMTLLERCTVSAFVGLPGYGAGSDVKSIFDLLGSLSGMKRVYALSKQTETLNAQAFPSMQADLSTRTINDNPDKVTYLAFTSGTTGAPKALMHSDNTLLANGRAFVRDWDHTRDLVIYCLGPLSHHLATIGVEQMLVTGCELVVNDLSKGERAFDRIIASEADYLMGVPTHAIDILHEMDTRNITKLGNVKTFYMSGTTIPAEVTRRLVERGITPQNTYGMTENGSHTSTLATDDLETLQQTVGQTCGRGNPCYELRLFRVDDRDTEVAPGEIGEIGGRGASLMLGYFGNNAATQGSFNAQGWFMSGDLGRFNERGDLQIVGRSKDLIIRGGHNIYPAEIEGLALKHASVIKAAAFPVPDERLGEKVCLGIIGVRGVEIDPYAMLDHLFDAGLSKYDMPEYYVHLDEFPMTASGKVLKRELSARVRDGRLDVLPVRWAGRRAEASL